MPKKDLKKGFIDEPRSLNKTSPRPNEEVPSTKSKQESGEVLEDFDLTPDVEARIAMTLD